MREYQQWKARALTEGMKPDERLAFDEVVDRAAAMRVQMFGTDYPAAYEQAVRETSDFVEDRLKKQREQRN